MNEIEIILEGGPLDGQRMQVAAGTSEYRTISYAEISEYATEERQKIPPFLIYRRIGKLIDRRPVFRLVNGEKK